MSTTPRRQRVRAMAPDERRAALIEVTIPLLHEYGPRVTTRQIADAAGVAEGTIFGVFPDKASLIRAAVISALNASSVVPRLAAIRATADLRTRLVEVADLMRNRLASNVGLVNLIRVAGMVPGTAWPPEELLHARERLQDAITELIEPDKHLLRRSPELTARLFLSLVMAAGRGFFGEPEVLGPDELVSLLLDGLLVEPHEQHQSTEQHQNQETRTQENPRADSTAA